MSKKLAPGVVILDNSDPEYIGGYPVRQELTILPADDSNQKPLGWIVKEYLGDELSRDPEKSETITVKDDLKPGDVVYAWCYKAIIQDDDGALYAKAGEHTTLALNFVEDPEKDDRAPMWIATAVINTRGLKRLLMES